MLTARVSSGIKKATYFDRGSDPANEKIEEKYEEGLKGFEAGDTSICLMKTFMEGQVISDEVEVTHGDVGAFTFIDKLDMFHRTLSLVLTLPKNALDGIFQGETVGAAAVLELLRATFTRMQKDWTEPTKRVAERWCAINKIQWFDEYDIEWLPTTVVTEKEQAELDEKKSMTAERLYNADIIDLDEARAMMKLEPKPIPRRGDMNIDVTGLQPEGEEEPAPPPDSEEETGAEA